MEISPAKLTDQTRLRELLRDNDFPQISEALVWNYQTDLAPPTPPYWQVAWHDNAHIVGAISIYIGIPVGIAEPLILDRNVLTEKRDVTRAVQALVFRAMAVLKHYGSSYIQFTVPDGLTSYARVLENRGALKCQTGTVFLKKLVGPNGRK